ncbi:MAG TPA: hypothetical protein VKV80_10705 [Streptosporangiaceae bacterium]|nr:hypothetical protein [Streptosporangiaceae bacterium]
MMGARASSGFEAARATADAILYEGYLLYPYRRSSAKNRVRWQFGVLVPRAWAQARGLAEGGVAGSAESWWQQAECLLEAAEDATIGCRVRFLQLQRKSVEERLPGGSYRRVDALEAGGRLELAFDEAVPREFGAGAAVTDLLAGERRLTLREPAGEDVEPLGTGSGDAGREGGRVVRRRWPLTATVTMSANSCPVPEAAEGRKAPSRLLRLRLRVENTGGAIGEDEPREEALRGSLIAAHALLTVRGGSFLSLLEPPRWAEQAARACSNVHVFPVLAGEHGSRDVMLASPILLYDYPQVAPESPGDLHDSAEIDEILSLRTLTLTDAEKREARATDPRAAAILDRIDVMPPEVMSRLHGAVRSLRPLPAGSEGPGPAAHPDPADARHTREEKADGRHAHEENPWPGGGADAGTMPPGAGWPRPRAPWWEPGADASVSPDTDSVVIAGTRVSRGSRVRLRPRRHGTDPQDVFLDGKTALVEAVLLDVDGSYHLAVTLEDDPGAELNQWYGRFRYFSPDEAEPLGPRT